MVEGQRGTTAQHEASTSTEGVRCLEVVLEDVTKHGMFSPPSSRASHHHMAALAYQGDSGRPTRHGTFAAHGELAGPLPI
jgi:hypothetical protein